MYHQFMQLANLDITTTPMEVGPTTHYIMGGIRVDADTQVSTVPGLFAAGECAAGINGANRLGGNSLSDLIVFGKRAGEYAAQFAKENGAGHDRQCADRSREQESALDAVRTRRRRESVHDPARSAGNDAGRSSALSARGRNAARRSNGIEKSARACGERFRHRATSTSIPAGIRRSICTTC